jgi:hypothetical protein
VLHSLPTVSPLERITELICYLAISTTSQFFKELFSSRVRYLNISLLGYYRPHRCLVTRPATDHSLQDWV